jgi:hypothetical protein
MTDSVEHKVVAQMRARIWASGKEQTESNTLRQRVMELRGEAKESMDAYERASSRLYVRSRPSGRRVAADRWTGPTGLHSVQ